MKTVLIAVLLVALGGSSRAFGEETPISSNNTPDSETAVAADSLPFPQNLLTEAALQDLSMAGLIALGIIGLLWIRRHTSQL